MNSYEDMMGSSISPSDHPAHNMPTATEHYAGDVIPVTPSPSIVPEQSPNLNILKSIKDQPPATKSPGTNFQSHPYWKNR